jgi:hypothetical protein
MDSGPRPESRSLRKRQNDSKRLVVFQAWGYREANLGKALNLGLFTVDDGGASRWVLYSKSA